MKPNLLLQSRKSFGIALAASLLAAHSARAVDFTWTGTTSGDWGTATNWDSTPTFNADNGIVFNGGSNLATFLNVDRTIGTIAFNDNADSAVGIQLTSTAGGSTGRTLTLGSGTVAPTITVTSGSEGNHTIGSSAYGAITLANNLTVTHNGTGTLTLGRAIGESGGARSLTKEGTGTLIISATPTYAGGTTINGGRLTYSNNGEPSAVNLGSGSIAVNSNGIFRLEHNSTSNFVIQNEITGSGTIEFSSTAGAPSSSNLRRIRIDNTTLGSTFSGEIKILANGRFSAWTGASETLAAHNLANNKITVESGGFLELASNATFPSTTTTIGSLFGSGTITRNTFTSAPANSTTTLLVGSGDFSGSINPNAITTAGTNIVLALTKNTSGTLILSGTNSYTGATTVDGGILQFARRSSLYNITTGSWTAANINVKSGGTLAFNVGGTNEFTTTDVGTLLTNLAASSSSTNGMNAGSNLGFDTTNASGGNFTISNVLTDTTGASGGARGLTKLGTGTLTLGGTNNTYTGTTTVSQGVLNIQNDNALGTTAGGTTVSSGAALELQGGITVGAEALTLNGTGIANGGALRNISGNNTYGGSITLASNALITSDAGLLTLDVTSGDAITSADFNVTFGGAGNISVADAIGIGSGTLTKIGTGTMTITSAVTYTGGTVVEGGTMVLDHGGAAGTGAISLTGATSVLKIGSGVALANGGNDITFTNTGARVVRTVASSGTYSLGAGIDIKSDLAGGIDTTAQILGGTNGTEAKDLTMSFSTSSAATNDGLRRTDVFKIEGTGTDTFVVQLILNGLADDSRLAFWNTSTNLWEHAGTNFFANTAWDSGTHTTVGQYGFDNTTDSAWAVVDGSFTGFDGSFTVIPEPTSALAGFLLGFGLVRRRRA